jgi:uncharacterized protein (DUF302 family)
MVSISIRNIRIIVATSLAFTLAGCGSSEPVEAERYEAPDRLFAVMERNVAASETLETIVAIDHSRLGAQAGSIMRPARVLIFSDPELEAQLLSMNPLVAIDLPLRVLAYEAVPGGEASVTFNSFDYLRSRYGLSENPKLLAMFDANMAAVLHGVDPEHVVAFANDTMQPDGIISISSPFDFEETIERLTAAIDAQNDTVWFGTVDFQERAQAQGIAIPPSRMLLFGGPAPGAKAMAGAPTLGLDAFCQKLLVWQDDKGAIKASFNDLLAIAERQGAEKSPALRIINHRLASTFESALKAD